MQTSLFLSREKLVMNSLLNRRQFLGSTGQGLRRHSPVQSFGARGIVGERWPDPTGDRCGQAIRGSATALHTYSEECSRDFLLWRMQPARHVRLQTGVDQT